MVKKHLIFVNYVLANSRGGTDLSFVNICINLTFFIEPQPSFSKKWKNDGSPLEPQPSFSKKWKNEGSPLEPQPSFSKKWKNDGSPLEPQPSFSKKWKNDGSPLDKF